jgi:rhomboid protease GluP
VAASPVSSRAPRPSGSDAPRSEPPDPAPFTRALVTLDCAVFLMEAFLARSLTTLPTRRALALGASYDFATLGEYRWETLVTACFLHDGVVHLAVNMIVLWYVGSFVERAAGAVRMAPLTLIAGAFGNLAGAMNGVARHQAVLPVGASGAICGILGAAVVLAWRGQGWRGPVTRAMAGWLALLVAFGFVSSFSGARVDNAAHLGGAAAGAAVAWFWRPRSHSRAFVGRVVGGCVAVLVACIAVVAIRDRSYLFAALDLRDRSDFTSEALADGRCGDAREGLLAVERLRGPMAPVTSLRSMVEAVCGRVDR